MSVVYYSSRCPSFASVKNSDYPVLFFYEGHTDLKSVRSDIFISLNLSSVSCKDERSGLPFVTFCANCIESAIRTTAVCRCVIVIIIIVIISVIIWIRVPGLHLALYYRHETRDTIQAAMHFCC